MCVVSLIVEAVKANSIAAIFSIRDKQSAAAPVYSVGPHLVGQIYTGLGAIMTLPS
jgi:hypothetical protein